MPSDQVVRYWFPAKRYGWGWGLPRIWEGWVTLSGFFGLLGVGLIVVPPRQSMIGFVAWVAVLTVMLIAICAWKGEPPRWRWGNE
jgi:hypothetical protein